MTSKVTKHGIAVYPLEAYGFLIGTRGPIGIWAALPVGRTSRWYDTSDRFALLDEARHPAARYARSVSLELVGVYHTESGGHPDFPSFISDPREHGPESLRDLHLLVTPTHGGDSIWGHRLYSYDPEKGWARCPHRPAAIRVETPGRNARRLMSGWRRIWGSVDYTNDHETEIPRVFGRPCDCPRCLTRRPHDPPPT